MSNEWLSTASDKKGLKNDDDGDDDASDYVDEQQRLRS